VCLISFFFLRLIACCCRPDCRDLRQCGMDYCVPPPLQPGASNFFCLQRYVNCASLLLPPFPPDERDPSLTHEFYFQTRIFVRREFAAQAIWRLVGRPFPLPCSPRPPPLFPRAFLDCCLAGLPRGKTIFRFRFFCLLHRGPLLKTRIPDSFALLFFLDLPLF